MELGKTLESCSPERLVIYIENILLDVLIVAYVLDLEFALDMERTKQSLKGRGVRLRGLSLVTSWPGSS